MQHWHDASLVLHVNSKREKKYWKIMLCCTLLQNFRNISIIENHGGYASFGIVPYIWVFDRKPYCLFIFINSINFNKKFNFLFLLSLDNSKQTDTIYLMIILQFRSSKSFKLKIILKIKKINTKRYYDIY